MSFNQIPIEVTKITDPRLQINNKREYVVLKGSLVNSWQQFPATNLSQSNIQITCNPPSRDITISRLVLKRFSFDITVTGTNASAGPLLNSGFYAPRAYPLLSITSAEQVSINNATITQAPMQQYWPSLMWYQNDGANRFGQYSLTPSMLDQFQRYEDGIGSVRNPLSEYKDNSYENTRGGYSGFVVNSNPNGGTVASLTLTVVEPIFLSPLVFGEGSNYTSGLIGIQNMTYTATLGNISRILSLVQGQGVAPGQIVLNPPSVTLTGASLLFEYLTPDPITRIPRSLESSYFSLVSYPSKSSAPVVPGSNVTLTMQSVQVTSIPRRMYVFARRDDSAQTAFNADSYFAINPASNPLTVTWNNNQFFAQSTTQDLYNMCVKNGLQMSYSQFTNFCGSVLCIDFGTDLGLMSDEAPGVLGNYQLGLTCQFVNTNSVESITPTMYVVLVYEGVFNIIDGNSSQMLGVLSKKDVLVGHHISGTSYKQMKDVYGGSFFSRLRDYAVKANNFLKKSKIVSSVARKIPHPKAQLVANLAERLGYGMSGGRVRGGNLRVKASQLQQCGGEDEESDSDNE